MEQKKASGPTRTSCLYTWWADGSGVSADGHPAGQPAQVQPTSAAARLHVLSIYSQIRAYVNKHTLWTVASLTPDLQTQEVGGRTKETMDYLLESWLWTGAPESSYMKILLTWCVFFLTYLKCIFFVCFFFLSKSRLCTVWASGREPSPGQMSVVCDVKQWEHFKMYLTLLWLRTL